MTIRKSKISSEYYICDKKNLQVNKSLESYTRTNSTAYRESYGHGPSFQ